MRNPAGKAVAALEKQLFALKKKLAAARKKAGRRRVPDYSFSTPTGHVRLSGLFNNKKELILIHNMGRQCPYCTMWADGFDGLLAYLEDRAAFVVSTPDSPQTQRQFAADRGWRFRIVSTEESPIRKDLGFGSNEKPGPGVSIFEKDARGGLFHVASAGFGPGDDYCSAWSLFDLLPNGAGKWAAKYQKLNVQRADQQRELVA